MKRLFFSIFFVVLAIVNGLFAQTATDPNEGSQLLNNGNGTYTFSWWGRAGNTYFLLQSDDLFTWSYLPVIETGSDQVIQYGFTSSAPKFFVKLRYTNIATTDPFNADFDGDGVSNWNELIQGTDPLSATLDTNGLPFDWEQFYNIPFGTDPNTLAARGDGLTLLQAFQQGLNPVDYYNGQVPILTLVSGTNQKGTIGSILSGSLTVMVTSGSTGLPLCNAPVTFFTGTAGGMLSSDLVGTTLSSTLALRTDANGLASVYFQLPTTYSPNVPVVATATSGTQTAQQTFTEFINPVVATNDSYLILGLASGSLSVLSNDYSFTGSSLKITSVTAPTKMAIRNGTNSILFTSGTNFGSDSFTYTVSDTIGNTATATTAFNVVPGWAANDYFTINTKQYLNLDVLSNDPYIHATSGAHIITGTYSNQTNPSKGYITVSGTGIRYNYTQCATGTDSFTYSVISTYGATSSTSTATVVVNIAPPPASGTQCYFTVHSLQVGHGVTALLDPYVFGDHAKIVGISTSGTSTSLSASGRFGIATVSGYDTNIIYNLTTGYGSYNTDTFTYTVEDAYGIMATGTITLYLYSN